MNHLVNPSFAARLYELKGYEVAFICDDSGSMTAPIGKSSLYLIVYLGSVHFADNHVADQSFCDMYTLPTKFVHILAY
jgi:hypothetical protein